MSEPRAHIRSSSPPQGTPALTTKQQRQATLLLRRIDRALQQDSTHQYDVILRLNEHKRRLEALIPRCRLLELPAEIREGIFILAVTEWGPVPGDDFIEMPPSEVSDARRRVPLLEKRAVRIDRLNRPAPPGRSTHLNPTLALSQLQQSPQARPITTVSMSRPERCSPLTLTSFRTHLRLATAPRRDPPPLLQAQHIRALATLVLAARLDLQHLHRLVDHARGEDTLAPRHCPPLQAR